MISKCQNLTYCFMSASRLNQSWKNMETLETSFWNPCLLSGTNYTSTNHQDFKIIPLAPIGSLLPVCAHLTRSLVPQSTPVELCRRTWLKVILNISTNPSEVISKVSDHRPLRMGWIQNLDTWTLGKLVSGIYVY